MTLDKTDNEAGDIEPGSGERSDLDRETGGGAGLETRELTGANELKALTHPVRIALIEALGFHGPLTATEAGELIGESPTTCSFHLRQLAKYHFVAEAGGGRGRRRPWRLANFGLRFSSREADAEARLASAALESLMVDRWIARFRHWEQTRGAYGRDWQDAASVMQTVTYVTPEELHEIIEAVQPVVNRFRSRLVDASERPTGSLPVEMILFSYPLQLTAAPQLTAALQQPKSGGSKEGGTG